MPPLSVNSTSFSEDITENNDGGLRKIIISSGNGLFPLPGDLVKLHLTAFFENGEQFLDTRTQNEPLSFITGKGQIIRALDLTVQTMKEGEKCLILTHPSYTSGPLPFSPQLLPQQSLVFQIELLEFEGEDISKKKNRSMLKTTMVEGLISPDPPHCDETCKVSYELYDYKLVNEGEGADFITNHHYIQSSHNFLNNTNNNNNNRNNNITKYLVEENENVELKINEPTETRVSFLLERIIKKMKPRDVCKVIINMDKIDNKTLYNNKLASLDENNNSTENINNNNNNNDNAILGKTTEYVEEQNNKKRKNLNLSGKKLLIVKLVECVRKKQHWEMGNDQLVAEASLQKQRGNFFFKEGKYYLAKKKYNHSLLLLESITFSKKHYTNNTNIINNKNLDNNNDNKMEISIEELANETKDIDATNNKINEYNFKREEIEKKKESLKVDCYLNLSLCHYKLKNYLRSFDNADMVTKSNPNHLKALFRRAMAHFEMSNYKECEEDLLKILKMDSTNRDALKQLKINKTFFDEEKERTKSVFSGMFQKFALFDSQRSREEFKKEGDVFSNIEKWENKMADGMMTLQQELEAFGETMPSVESYYGKENNKNKTNRQHNQSDDELII